MKRKLIFATGLFATGFFCGMFYEGQDSRVDLVTQQYPYVVRNSQDIQYLQFEDHKKIITSDAQLGTVYYRMQGLLNEDLSTLTDAYKRIQNSIRADSTSSRD